MISINVATPDPKKAFQILTWLAEIFIQFEDEEIFLTVEMIKSNE